MVLRSLLLLFLAVGAAHVQTTAQRLEALILDKDDRQPVAYANVGIQGTETGTNSDSLGRFVLEVPSDAKDKALTISLIGYEAYKARISDVLEQKTILLQKSRQTLGEVIVKPAKLTTAILGNDVTCGPGGDKDQGLPFPYLYEQKKKGKVVKTDTITEIGTLMKVKRKKTFIDSVQINIGICTHASILYRLNVYEEIDGEFKNILREPIYIRLTKEQVGKSIKVDLTDKNLVVNNNFIVSIEKVKDLGEGSLTICGKLFGAAMYMRIASRHELFMKLPVIGMGITSYVTFSEEK